MNKIFSYGHLQNNNESTFSSETLIFYDSKAQNIKLCWNSSNLGKFIYQ